MSESNLQQVFFVQKINDNEFETESLWCKKEGDYFIIDNIPFIARRVALGDTIKAEYDEEDKAFILMILKKFQAIVQLGFIFKLLN